MCFDSQLGQEIITATPGQTKHQLPFYPYLFRSTDKTIQEQQRQIDKYEAQSSTVDEMAKLRAGVALAETAKKLKEVQAEYTTRMAEYQSLTSLYNQLREQYKTELDGYSETFAYVTGDGMKIAEQGFEAVLSERDRLLLATSARLNELEAPQFFETIGEYERANRLIKALWESDKPTCLDASEIVPYGHNSGFEVFFNLRDRKARGKLSLMLWTIKGISLRLSAAALRFEILLRSRKSPSHQNRNGFPQSSENQGCNL